MARVRTHIMSQGDAEEGLAPYARVFEDFKVMDVERYGAGEERPEGALKLASVTFAGHELLVFDSPPIHSFTFAPAMCLFVDFEAEEPFEATVRELAEGGKVLMPPDAYGFSRRFGWLTDRFGLSWQLNVP